MHACARTSMTAMLSRRSGRAVTDDGVDRFLALSAVQARITRTRHVVWNHTRSLAIATVQRASFRGGNLNPPIEYEFQSSWMTFVLTLTLIWTHTWMRTRTPGCGFVFRHGHRTTPFKELYERKLQPNLYSHNFWEHFDEIHFFIILNGFKNMVRLKCTTLGPFCVYHIHNDKPCSKSQNDFCRFI